MPPLDFRMTWSGDFTIAYDVVGDGPVDIIHLPGFISNVAWNRFVPPFAAFLESLGSFARVISVDPRGVGASDRYPPSDAATLEESVDDVLAVMSSASSGRPCVFGVQDAGFIAMLAAASHPDLIGSLVLFGAAPSYVRSDETPWQWSRDAWAAQAGSMRDASANDLALEYIREAAPTFTGKAEALEWIKTLLALTTGRGAGVASMLKYSEIDLRGILESITVPTLVLHRTLDPVEPLQSARYLADKIANARLVELPGRDALPWIGDSASVVAEIAEFVTGSRHAPAVQRELATVLFTDIVGSTETATALGDERWKRVLAEHDALARNEVERHRGRFIDSTGDGLLAVFDGPARAVHCALAIGRSVRPLGVEIRAGCHTGEVELDARNVRGIAVHIGARVASLAAANEVLVSRTVRDLVAGSGLTFQARGPHRLKGVEDEWDLFRASDDGAKV